MFDFEIENPNDVTLPEPVIRESPAPIARNSRVEITTENLDDFLAEVSRLSEILTQTHESLKNIEKSTAVVQKLQSIADMDLKAFKNKFEDMVNNLDLNQHAKEAVQAALMPLTKEYHDSSVQLKNLIFELEGRILPEKKTNSFKSLFVIIGLVLALGGGGFAWFQMQKSGGEVQNTVSKVVLPIVLLPGAEIIKADGSQITIKSDFVVEKYSEKNGFLYFENQNKQYKIDKNSLYVKVRG